jgi:rhodanese-related sulfurtransferase
MRKLIKSTIIAMAVPAFTVTFPVTASAEEAECPFDEFNENRRGIVGCYHSEISPAEAFAETVAKRGKWGNPSEGAVLLDVRSTPEYRAGHPEHSYNAPYPFIYQYCNDVGETGPQDDRQPDGACKDGGNRIPQSAEDFVAYVESIVPDKNTPIYTMCRTGVRSVGAAEALTLAGYKEVRNIWEGFVGIHLTAPNQTDSALPVDWRDDDGVLNPAYEPNELTPSLVDLEGWDTYGAVDLNHDGSIDDEDKNGWRYHQGLPYETRLLPHLIFADRVETYYWD